MSRSRIALPAYVAAGHLLAAGSALAADPLFSPSPVASGAWLVTVKGTIGIAPTWSGTDKTELFGYPSLSIRRAGVEARFSAPDDAPGFALYDSGTFQFGPLVRYRAGRYTGSDRRLIGLDDVRWALEPGVFVEYWPTPNIRTRAELRRGFNGHEGVVGTLGVDGVARVGSFVLSAGPRVEFGDTTFARDVYGVTLREAALNGIVTPYRPTGGFTSAGVAAAGEYRWSEAWSTTLFGGYKRLVGPAADSPVTRRFGSPNQFNVGLTVSYSFTTTGF